MVKANLKLANGTTVVIDGSVEEVANLLDRFSGDSERPKASRKKSNDSSHQRKKVASASGPTGLIRQLRDNGFFKSRRTLGEVQKKLEELGHIYAQTSLSPIMVRLVKGKELRRIKEQKGWVYVG